RAFLQRHRRAAQIFSLVVAGYHAVFVVWLASLLGNALVLLAFLGCTAAFLGLRRHLFLIAVGLFVITLMLFALAVSGPLPEARVALEPAAAAHVVLPMALGFALAP